MTRLICVEYAGATYHVMGRGNQGKAIYGSDEDRRWVSERLRMEDESRVTQAIRRVKANGAKLRNTVFFAA